MGKKLKLNPSIRPFPQSASKLNAETAFELPPQFINALHSSNWRICSEQEDERRQRLSSGASPTTSAAPPFWCLFFHWKCPPIITRHLVSIGHKNVRTTQHLQTNLANSHRSTATDLHCNVTCNLELCWWADDVVVAETCTLSVSPSRESPRAKT